MKIKKVKEQRVDETFGDVVDKVHGTLTAPVYSMYKSTLEHLEQGIRNGDITGEDAGFKIYKLDSKLYDAYQSGTLTLDQFGVLYNRLLLIKDTMVEPAKKQDKIVDRMLSGK